MELTVEARELLEEAMRLPEPGRSALLLRDGYDLPYADIAQVLDMTVTNVKVTLHRTRKRLRERVTGVER